MTDRQHRQRVNEVADMILASQEEARLRAENGRLRRLLSSARAVMLCAGLPRRGVDDVSMMLAFYKEIDTAIVDEQLAGKQEE